MEPTAPRAKYKCPNYKGRCRGREVGWGRPRRDRKFQTSHGYLACFHCPAQPPTTNHMVFFKHKVDFFFSSQEHGIKISRQTQMQLSAARGIPQLGLSKAKTGSLRGRSQPCCEDLGRLTVFPEHFTLTGHLISCRPCK